MEDQSYVLQEESMYIPLQVGESFFFPYDGEVESVTMSQPGVVEYEVVPGGIVFTRVGQGTTTLSITGIVFAFYFFIFIVITFRF